MFKIIQFCMIMLCISVNVFAANSEAENTFNSILQAPFKVLNSGINAYNETKTKAIDSVFDAMRGEKPKTTLPQESRVPTSNTTTMTGSVAVMAGGASMVKTGKGLAKALKIAEELYFFTRGKKKLIAFSVLSGAVIIGGEMLAKKYFGEMTEEQKIHIYEMFVEKIVALAKSDAEAIHETMKKDKDERFCSNGEEKYLKEYPERFKTLRPGLPFVNMGGGIVNGKSELLFGDMDSYGNLKKKQNRRDSNWTTLDRDHIPSKAAIVTWFNNNKQITQNEKDNIENNASTIAIPRFVHKETRTYLNENKPLINNDAKNLKQATILDIAKISYYLMAEKNTQITHTQFGQYIESVFKLIVRNYLLCIYQ